MNARTSPPIAARARPATRRTVTVLWILLLAEAALGLFMAIYLSDVAGDYRSALGDAGIEREEPTRFAAGGAFVFAIAAFIASNGARRHRMWSWTLAAVLQLILAIVAGIALFAAGGEGSPAAYLLAFALAAATMILLSTAPVRRALGQE
jgi:ATP/ADP translocase